MPASATWVYTPNKKDHLTSGFTTKVLYNYQATEARKVDDAKEVFETIKSNLVNYKGTNYLPQNYFLNADDGRTFRITMYFLKPYDGYDINIIQQLYDVTNSTTYDFTFDVGNINNEAGGESLVKYECYLSYFVDPNGPVSIVQATGSINYAAKANGGEVRILKLFVNNTLTYGPTPDYEIRIFNNGESFIAPLNLLIEEIS